jgi:gliding-associated putative ABC transporter substrate-binding component GldG
MKKITITSIVLLALILLLVNVLSQQFFLRLDLTEGRQYTLSNATRNILKGIENPVTVTAYFSEDLPPDLLKIKKDFQEMLVEFRNSSKGKIDYEFINPNQSEAKEQEAVQNGIQPVIITVREKDQSKQQKAFLGAVLKMGEQKDVIPVVVSGTGMEYSLATGVKKMAVKDKPSIGFITGHGEPQLQELSQVYQSLSILYTIMPVNLDDSIDLRQFRALALVSPRDSVPPAHLEQLDSYLNAGGKLLIAVNRVDADLQSQSGNAVSTGVEKWLETKSISIEPSFVLDAQCGTINIQQQQGFFTMSTPVSFPYLPLITSFPEHPITKGLEQVLLPFASPVRFSGTGSTFTPILVSSSNSALSQTPVFFDVLNKKWTATDFQEGSINLGGILETPDKGNLVVFGDGDFAISGQGGQSEDNISLMVNAIDWLSDDTGLIELRTKAIATRPISDEYLGDENSGKRNFMKYLNFGLPLILVIGLGLLRQQRQRSLRMKRMQERYS